VHAQHRHSHARLLTCRRRSFFWSGLSGSATHFIGCVVERVRVQFVLWWIHSGFERCGGTSDTKFNSCNCYSCTHAAHTSIHTVLDRARVSVHNMRDDLGCARRVSRFGTHDVGAFAICNRVLAGVLKRVVWSTCVVVCRA
jgi:hypothetical protein